MEPASIQLWVEIWLSGSPVHNQKLGHAAFSRGSHTGREKFATGPFVVRRWIEPGFPGSSIAQYNDVVAGNYKKLG